MEEIFKQYSTPIIIAIVIVALIAIVSFLLASDGPVSDAFSGMLDSFIGKADLGAGEA
jgi:hypothetical protein